MLADKCRIRHSAMWSHARAYTSAKPRQSPLRAFFVAVRKDSVKSRKHIKRSEKAHKIAVLKSRLISPSTQINFKAFPELKNLIRMGCF
jgi:hypothetical protein